MFTFPLLTPDELDALRTLLASAPWEDGRASAGNQAVHVKRNQQLPRNGAPERQAQTLVRQALDRSADFLAAALPLRVVPPYFNRYRESGEHYGAHIDGSIRTDGNGERVRTDLSCTVFLSDPAGYEGGELVVRDGQMARSVKLPAGHAVLYSAHHVHEVRPVTRGERLASFFWVQSLVRSSEQRRLLHELDQSLMALRADGETDVTVALAGTYHNLLRMWSET